MLKTLLTNYFRPFPVLLCGCTPTVYLEHVCILLFLCWVQSTFFYLFLFGLFAFLFLVFLFLPQNSFLHVLTGWLKILNSVCIPVFFICVCVSFRKGFISWNMLSFCDGILHLFRVCCLRFCCCSPSLLPPWREPQCFHSWLGGGYWQTGRIAVLVPLDPWFFFFSSTFPFLPCVWFTYCQKPCSSKANPFPSWYLIHQLWPVFSVLV